MNYGTKVRTILAVLTTINTILAVTDVTQFGNDTVSLIYKIASVVVNAIIVGINTYFNNDYSEEACIGTGVTRQLKAEKKANYNGDFFFVDEPAALPEEDDGINDIDEENLDAEEEEDELLNFDDERSEFDE